MTPISKHSLIHFKPLTREELIYINYHFTADVGQHHTRESSLLDSITNPHNLAYLYQETGRACIKLFVEKLVDHHVFGNGNKRTAATAEYMMWDRYEHSVMFHRKRRY